MDKFTPVTSAVIPLPLKDVDTDQIIPAQYLTSVSKEGYGKNLFRRLRDTDPSFPLNLEKYSGSKILVTGNNFGCGSSREHAVWALQGAGFRAIIAPSFADIFSGNSAKNGLLLVTLPEPIVETILARGESENFVVGLDLETQQVSFSDGTKHPFSYDSFQKHCLLNGLEDIDYLISKREEIDRFRSVQEKTRYSSSC